MPTLVVQMGHTGRPRFPGDTASVGTAGEQDFARAVGAACVRLLDGRGGWRVRLIIADPPAGEYRGDAFVAIHADGSTDQKVRGGSVGWQSPDGEQFADAWQAAYDRRGWPGLWQDDNYTENLHFYYGVGAAIGAGNRRAFIAECGHLTSPADRALMTGPGGHDRVALAIADALGIPTDTPVEDDMPFTPQQLQEHVYAAVSNLFVDAHAGTTPQGLAAKNALRGLLDGAAQPAQQIDYDQLAKALLRHMGPTA